MDYLSLLIVVCMLTYAFEIVFGLAGTIMMLFIMAPFIPEKTLVIFSTLPQLMVAAIGLGRSPKTVEAHFLLNMLGFAALGSIIGYILFRTFSIVVFHYLLSGAIICFGLFLVSAPVIIKFSQRTCYVLDFFAGISQQLFGISGPIAMTRIIGSFHNKTVIRNYALAFFLSLNSLRLGSYIVDGSITKPILWMMLISAPFLFVSFWFSNHLHFKVNDVLFRKLVSWMILFGGLVLLFTKPH